MGRIRIDRVKQVTFPITPLEQFKKKTGTCDAWLAEGRVICCELLTEDGVNYSCAHCGKDPSKEDTPQDKENHKEALKGITRR